MFDFVNDEIFEPTEFEKCIEEFATKISVGIVEKQNELMLTTIQRIGGDEFIDITIDKDKVIEALTDYVNKQKGIPNMEVRHGEWDEVHIQHEGYGEIYYNHKECKISPDELYKCPFEYCPRCGAKMDGGKSE